MAHVFISYSKRDAAYARKLTARLLSEGFDVWIDDRSLRSSEDWWRSIVLALRSAAAVVVLISPEADASDWVQREITLAMKYEKPLFPLHLAGSLDTPNWELFVRTQIRDVRDGHLPGEEFSETLAQHATRRKQGRDLTTTMAFPAVDPNDMSLIRELNNPPPRRLPPGYRRLVVPLAVLVLVGALGVGLLSNPGAPGPEIIESPTPEVTEVAEASPVPLDSVASIEALNAWRSSQDPPLPALVFDDTLQVLAEEQMSFLYSLSTSALPDTRTQFFRGQDQIGAIASARGYEGDAQLFVEITPGEITLESMLLILENRADEVHTRYDEIGLAAERSPITGLLYFVVVLGTG